MAIFRSPSEMSNPIIGCERCGKNHAVDYPCEFIASLERERDQWRECAEGLVDYARECLASLSGGCGHPYCEREMDTIRKDIARFERLKEGGK